MWSDDADLLLMDFIRILNKDNQQNFIKINRDHLNSLSVVDACIESSKTGKKINLDFY